MKAFNKTNLDGALMRQIYFKILSKDDYVNYTAQVIEEYFNIKKQKFERDISGFHDKFVDDISILFEFPYIDKYYRDSYYTYYSTKHIDYSRNSIRLSFFHGTIQDSYFRDIEGKKRLQEAFLGFMTLRPTKRNTIGRCVFSPKLFKNNKFVCCITKFPALVNGVKLEVYSFPHFSQDQETISCAEAAILGLMDYFGTRYDKYSPLLPSDILEQLSQRSDERQLPTSGLSPDDISYLLKNAGFSPKIYSKDTTNNPALFRLLLDVYVESGIPIIAILDLVNNPLAHAIIIIGREKQYCISNDENKYVVIDDNQPPYNVVPFNNFSEGYIDESFRDCQLSSFIVPLYSKVYVDAELAGAFIKEIKMRLLDGHGDYLERLFLTSSRSFKDEISSYEKLNPDIKDLLVETAMPKFIWVAEILTKESLDSNEIVGLIIIDATETNLDLGDHLLFCLFENNLYLYSINKTEVKKINVDKFPLYQHNLKGRHSLWQNI